MATATMNMAKKTGDNGNDKERGDCTYVSVKIDDELPPIIRRAAAHVEISIQELMSNLLNEGAAKILGQKPITRRKPPERKPKP